MTTILIVDDNFQNLYMLETIIKSSGYKVISAKNGAEALDLGRENSPDLIITDILMPVMDGFELCRLWKADDQLKHVPFIFYTATYTDPKDEQLALDLGAEKFIIKPQQPEVLVQIVNDILNEYSKREFVSQEKPLGEEMEVLREYNAVLFHKLETKVLQLERELTKRKNAQRSLLQLNEELEARVDERTKSLKDAHEKIIRQEKLAAIGKLAGSLSHELRNPLGVISNSIYYLNMKLSMADENIKKHLDFIQNQSTRATKIINDILDLARMKPGESFNVDLHTLLNETLEQIQAPENVIVKINYDDTIPKVWFDPITIQQAFLNIITNAFQAMPDGGELEIRTSLNQDMIEIAFKDTGVGIPEENLPRLFEPLFSTKVNGIGLGLSITKEIIEICKGTIEVESVVGIGSTFTIKMPVPDNEIQTEGK
ncbi:MAG TPA: response regulator [Candidatus Lokiarchaeia archaeon]|nr:response regulator [Candidatus Lokiarchaeia archaeon]